LRRGRVRGEDKKQLMRIWNERKPERKMAYASGAASNTCCSDMIDVVVVDPSTLLMPDLSILVGC